MNYSITKENVMYTILGFLYGKNLNAYEVAHRKCYYLLGSHRNTVSQVRQYNFLLPYIAIPVESPYYVWMKIFDRQAMAYWSAHEQEYGVVKIVNGLLARQPVMTYEEFCKLPGAMITYEGDKKVKRINPYFRAAYNSYKTLGKIADNLHNERELDAEKRSNLRRCSIKFLYDNARKFYFVHERFEYASEIQSKIKAEVFLNRRILSEPVAGTPEI